MNVGISECSPTASDGVSSEPESELRRPFAYKVPRTESTICAGYMPIGSMAVDGRMPNVGSRSTIVDPHPWRASFSTFSFPAMFGCPSTHIRNARLSEQMRIV